MGVKFDTVGDIAVHIFNNAKEITTDSIFNKLVNQRFAPHSVKSRSKFNEADVEV